MSRIRFPRHKEEKQGLRLAKEILGGIAFASLMYFFILVMLLLG